MKNNTEEMLIFLYINTNKYCQYYMVEHYWGIFSHYILNIFKISITSDPMFCFWGFKQRK